MTKKIVNQMASFKNLMKIEEFVSKSEGHWNSMRSGHSLAFQQFEEITSQIDIIKLNAQDQKVKKLLKDSSYNDSKISSPFLIRWEGKSNWEENNKVINGDSIIVPIPKSNKEGIMLRSSGYAERIKVTSKYIFLDDGTLLLSTQYTNTTAEERIWFLSDNVRCRSSVLITSDTNGILQTSFASEIRKLKIIKS